MQQNSSPQELAALAARIKAWGSELGFQAVGIGGIDLSSAEAGLTDWLAQGFHGGMDYMAKHGLKRARPAELVPGTLSVISVRMDYLSVAAQAGWTVLEDGSRAYISRYALGRDYHKVLRNRLDKLAQRIREEVGEFGYRVFTDSAPVLEVELARRTRLGWRGKHTLLLSREQGSWFFLGELFTDLPLPADIAGDEHCGSCRRCLDICPTQAIVAPYRLDARRCISYLTIEHRGSIPLELRPLIGNRIYGCDDCQLVCPWNRFAQISTEADFAVRHGLDDVGLVELFAWDEATFNTRMAGSPIYRIGHEQWQRNLAVALGNAPPDAAIRRALQQGLALATPLVAEHIAWALDRQDGVVS
ncbi:tRNA epoxyqueuosine(34) reductase QueG [Ferriphaselus sp. R-1]|uniref:tRNA epoxyqueuosine(34) reductase QueG n=1 Tax=Ferriphaselus sp. R-1 TaxID=1485544 RepID=UPI000558DB6E|nr:tRNA epoxyqueuosine(34) reductase QueG [Ferriphaselus sp. R-1]